VKGFFGDGTTLKDTYSGITGVVQKGKLVLDTPFDVVLIESISAE
jgi:alpha-amylase